MDEDAMDETGPSSMPEEEDEEEEEMMTSAEVLAKLEEAWRNEKFAPNLLEAKTDLVDCIIEQVMIILEEMGRSKRISHIESSW